MSAETKFSKFVRRVVNSKEAYTRIQLIQVMTSGGSNTLYNHDLGEKFGYSEEKISELVSVFLTTAQEDADGHSGLTTYKLKALKGATVGEYSAAIRLRRQDDEHGEDDALGESEQPNLVGITAQLMRHNEVLMRTLVQQTEVLSTQSSAIIARQTSQIEHYDNQHWKFILEREELASQKEEREIERMRATKALQHRDETLKMLKPLVPAMISKIKGISPEAKSGAQVSILKAIMQDISPEQMEQIANVLGDKSLALVELYLDSKKEVEPDEFQEAKH